MRHLVALAAVLSAAAPLAASPMVTDTFRAKSGYEVAVSHSGETMLLDGFNPRSRDHFHLAVTPAGRVTGVFKGQPVDYVVPARVGTEVAVNVVR